MMLILVWSFVDSLILLILDWLMLFKLFQFVGDAKLLKYTKCVSKKDWDCRLNLNLMLEFRAFKFSFGVGAVLNSVCRRLASLEKLWRFEFGDILEMTLTNRWCSFRNGLEIERPNTCRICARQHMQTSCRIEIRMRNQLLVDEQIYGNDVEIEGIE